MAGTMQLPTVGTLCKLHAAVLKHACCVLLAQNLLQSPAKTCLMQQQLCNTL